MGYVSFREGSDIVFFGRFGGMPRLESPNVLECHEKRPLSSLEQTGHIPNPIGIQSPPENGNGT